MNLPLSELRSRSEFDTDAEYQRWAKELFRRHGLDDGYAHTVSLRDGSVQRGGRMKVEPEKLSKSSQA